MCDKERKPNGYWHVYENCYNAAKECHTRGEFKKRFKAGYHVARKNKWLDKFDWFAKTRKEDGYWQDYNNCYEAAKQCKSRTELSRKFYEAYDVARRNDWLKDYSWFEETINQYSDKIHVVYAYYFFIENTVYIGRTNNKEIRHKSHSTTDCPVKRFADNHNIVVPEMTVLEDCLTLEESLIYEDLYVEQHRNSGWNLINTGKTGVCSGSVGALKHKWNVNACNEAAKECKTIMEFRKKYCGAYKAAVKNNWLKDYTWLNHNKKPAGYWNYENCYKAAKQCKTKKEFSKKFSRAYSISCENKWIEDYDWLFFERRPNKFWHNYQVCIDAAKECKSKKEFSNKYPNAYDVARRKKWLYDYTWFIETHELRTKPKKWTYEKCFELSKQCTRRVDFQKKYVGAYTSSLKNGWLDEFFPKVAA